MSNLVPIDEAKMQLMTEKSKGLKSIVSVATVMGVLAIFVILYKVTVEFPKAWRRARTTSEKAGALTILL